MDCLNFSYHVFIDSFLNGFIGSSSWFNISDVRWIYIFTAVLLLIVTWFFIFALSHAFYRTYFRLNKSYIKGKRILVVVAHPDDECMFFGPAIVNLTKKDDVEVHLMCLSEGNYYGDGKTRSRELWESCLELGIPSGNIRLFSNGNLPDDPLIDWDTEIIGSLISWHVQALKVNAVLTFDDYGVSGHRNHIAIYRSVRLLMAKGKLPEACKCYILKSESIFLKYIGFFIVLLKRKHSNIYACSHDDHNVIKSAMSKHASQYVWFRRLFITFSSYSYLNTFTRLQC